MRRIEGTVHAVSECFLRPELIEELFVHERLHENDERSRPPRAFAHLKVVNHHVVRLVFVERLQAKQVRALRYARHSRLRPGAVGNRTARQIFANAFAQNVAVPPDQAAQEGAVTSMWACLVRQEGDCLILLRLRREGCVGYPNNLCFNLG